jgi:hypothetical protein
LRYRRGEGEKGRRGEEEKRRRGEGEKRRRGEGEKRRTVTNRKSTRGIDVNLRINNFCIILKFNHLNFPSFSRRGGRAN